MCSLRMLSHCWNNTTFLYDSVFHYIADCYNQFQYFPFEITTVYILNEWDSLNTQFKNYDLLAATAAAVFLLSDDDNCTIERQIKKCGTKLNCCQPYEEAIWNSTTQLMHKIFQQHLKIIRSAYSPNGFIYKSINQTEIKLRRMVNLIQCQCPSENWFSSMAEWVNKNRRRVIMNKNLLEKRLLNLRCILSENA